MVWMLWQLVQPRHITLAKWKNPMDTARKIAYTITLPIRITSNANLREHWAVRADRARNQRRAVAIEMHGTCPSTLRRWQGGICVTLCRIGKRLLDDDNLAGGFKAVRDEIAAQLGRDDGPASGITWRYTQIKGSAYGVHITIEAENAITG